MQAVNTGRMDGKDGWGGGSHAKFGQEEEEEVGEEEAEEDLRERSSSSSSSERLAGKTRQRQSIRARTGRKGSGVI